MSNSDYEYTAHNGNHFVVTHQNGVPRYNKVTDIASRFTPLNPENLGSGALRGAARKLKGRAQTRTPMQIADEQS